VKAAFGTRAWGWTPNRATCAPLPWVAEITGPHPVYGLARRFLRAKLDHDGARDGVSASVHCWWTLASSRFYQARYLTGKRSGWTTRWLTVSDDGDVIDTSREEVTTWANACSASTS
jgi:hypothetical protein